jgi:glucose 1-dehydrogenase
MTLAGKTAVVTGSATGIGQGIALELAKQGVNVTVTHNNAPADKTMALIREVGGTAIDLACDVGKPEQVTALFAETAKAFGGVDILVNNAAVQPNKWLLEYTEEEYDLVMNINVMGYWRCMREAFPYLKNAHCGRIISIASIHAKRPTGFECVYSISKGAIQMMTREAAIAYAPYGVTVNTIAPGAIQVPTRSGNYPFKTGKPVPHRKMPYGGFLSGRVGNPADLGYLAAFLAAEESQFINGATLRSDGGAVLI